ncbi:MAG TPA: hypothetical protein VI322_01950 [Candidatus Saccharimonadia bacterium]
MQEAEAKGVPEEERHEHVLLAARWLITNGLADPDPGDSLAIPRSEPGQANASNQLIEVVSRVNNAFDALISERERQLEADVETLATQADMPQAERETTLLRFIAQEQSSLNDLNGELAIGGNVQRITRRLEAARLRLTRAGVGYASGKRLTTEINDGSVRSLIATYNRVDRALTARIKLERDQRRRAQQGPARSGARKRRREQGKQRGGRPEGATEGDGPEGEA